MKMNFFRQESAISQMENTHEVVIIASRIYIVLLSAGIIILMLINGLTQVTTSVTVKSPTLAIYEKLQAEYSNSLSCPCKQIATPYSTFLTITASYHQVRHVIDSMCTESI